MKRLILCLIGLLAVSCSSGGGGGGNGAENDPLNVTPGADTNSDARLYQTWQNEQFNNGFKFTSRMEFKKGVVINHMTCEIGGDKTTVDIAVPANITVSTIQILENKTVSKPNNTGGNCNADFKKGTFKFQLSDDHLTMYSGTESFTFYKAN